MKKSAPATPRLTEHERRALTLLIEGHSLKDLQTRLPYPPRTLERTIHRGLTKLEVWVQQAWPGETYESPQEQAIGITKSREAERLINRRIVQSGYRWGCVVILALPNKDDEPELERGTEELSRQILQRLRQSDVVTKWHTSEWVIFLAGVDEAQLSGVLNRLSTLNARSWPIFCEAQAVKSPDATFLEIATQCHQELMSRYATHGMSALWRASRAHTS
ncbi:MAG: hypothetical protein OWU84_10490 [Firmicutes bacterium]|nr:hypothetical protein [Bacillota bacterium]